MLTEFDLIHDDFVAELDAIEGMIAALLTTGATITAGRSRVAGANAAVLLLAATFEEFVRQSVKAVFEAKARTVSGIGDFPKKIAATVWRRSLERLARTPFEDVETNSRDVTDKVTATIGFCITKDVTADVADALAHNDNNMRPGELNRLFNQIGLTNMCGRACENQALVQLLGCETPGKAVEELEARLEGFFRRRNEIAHAIQLNSSSGPTSLASDVALFRIFARALADESAKYVAPPQPPMPAEAA